MHAVEAPPCGRPDATGDAGLADQAPSIRSARHCRSRAAQAGGSQSTSIRTGSRCLITTATAPTTRSSRTGQTRRPRSRSGLGCCSICEQAPPEPPKELLPAAVALFDPSGGRRLERRTGNPGFVYTTDWDGRPVVRDRMHWVVAEAISAAAALHQVNRRPAVRGPYCRTWWEYAETYLMDRRRRLRGTTSSIPTTGAIGTVWPGKPDLYHAVQATVDPAAAPCSGPRDRARQRAAHS